MKISKESTFYARGTSRKVLGCCLLLFCISIGCNEYVVRKPGTNQPLVDGGPSTLAFEIINDKSGMDTEIHDIRVGICNTADKSPRRVFDAVASLNEDAETNGHPQGRTVVVGMLRGGFKTTDSFEVRESRVSGNTFVYVVKYTRCQLYDGLPGIGRVYFSIDVSALPSSIESVTIKFKEYFKQFEGAEKRTWKQQVNDIDVDLPPSSGLHY